MISQWDRETLNQETLIVYRIDEYSNFHDFIDLFAKLETAGSNITIPYIDLLIKLDSISETSASVTVGSANITRMQGAALIPSGTVITNVFAAVNHLMTLSSASLPDLDLHAYTSDGKHVGINYGSGIYEVQIPGTICSGDMHNEMEWILVPEGINATFIVDSIDNRQFLDSLPEMNALTNGSEDYTVFATYYSAQGKSFDSQVFTGRVAAGDASEILYRIISLPNSTFTVQVNDLIPANIYTVKITQSGLPEGASWSITIANQKYPTTNQEIMLRLANGQYSYAIDQPEGYFSTPTQGTIIVAGTAVNTQLEFNQTTLFSLLPEPTTLAIIALVLVGIVFVSILLARRKKLLLR